MGICYSADDKNRVIKVEPNFNLLKDKQIQKELKLAIATYIKNENKLNF